MRSDPGTPPSGPALRNRGDRPRWSASSTPQSYRCPEPQMNFPNACPVFSSKQNNAASEDESPAVPIKTLPWLTTGLPKVLLPSLATHFVFFAVDRSTSPWSFFFPKEHQSGSPFSVSDAILRNGRPPHDGQSAAHTAVAETTRDKRMLPDDTALPRETPVRILLTRVEMCGLAFILLSAHLLSILLEFLSDGKVTGKCPPAARGFARVCVAGVTTR